VALPRVVIRSLAEGEQTLTREAEAHLVRVLRLREDDAFVAFDPGVGLEARGVILRLKKGQIRVRLDAPTPAPPDRFIAWVHGLPKEGKADAIVRDTTELGATLVIFAPCARSVPKLERAEARVKRWQRIADEAARQSGRVYAPQIRIERSWDDALLLASVNAGAKAALFCLYEKSETPLTTILPGAIAFAVGPEGGLEEKEIASAQKNGFAICSLGDRILRTETVPAAVLGAVLIGARP